MLVYIDWVSCDVSLGDSDIMVVAVVDVLPVLCVGWEGRDVTVSDLSQLTENGVREPGIGQE